MGAGSAAAAIGLLALAGWFAGSQALVRIAPDLPPMAFPTALGVALAGLALVFSIAGRAGWATLAAGMGVLLCLATLAQYLSGIRFGLEAVLAPGTSALVGEQGGRMPLNSAVALLLCCAAVLTRTLGRGPAAHPGSRGVLGALALATGLAGLLGFVLGVPGAYGWGLSASMALHGAVAVLALGVGVLAQAWRDEDEEAAVVPLWAPLIVLLAGAAVTLMLWLAIDAQMRDAARQRVDNSVHSIANLVNAGIEDSIAGLARMGGRLQRAGDYAAGLWRPDARAYLRDFPGLRGIVVVRPDGTADAEPALRPALLEQVRADLAAALRSGASRAAPGSVALGFGPWSDGSGVVYMAVPQSGSAGSVVGAMDLGALVHDVMSGIARPYYTLRLRRGTDEIYRSAGEATFAAGADEVAAAMPLTAAGPDWSIEVAATVAAARGTQSDLLPWAILIAGTLMSALLAGAMLMGRYAQLNRLEAEASLAELRRTQGRMERLNSDLEESNRELEAFAYSVSHDLRAPLRHVAGFVELLETSLAGKDIGEQGQRYLGIIRDAAVRMGTLIDDLLAFSRVGRTQIEPVPVDLEKLVQEIRDEIRHDIGDRAIEWQVGVLPVLQADRSMMRLALGNLIGNAVKFTRRRNPARIAVEARAEGDTIVLAVRDNGVGFDPRHANKLFGVFQRLHRAEEFEGTGIGLANVRRIVLRHGGRTWAESSPGEGASFFCAFPSTSLSSHPGKDASP